ncbi:MAG TPA: GNAT family N-acetyltransferase [Thermoleophilaceae bacterium]|nr:GNAT family N-acetyltransferase [Thermoleophilaceae bacterium]
MTQRVPARLGLLRELSPGETRLAFDAMRELRTHWTDEEEFVREVDEVQRQEGYRLVGAFDGERCLAVAGFRELHTLAWGHVIYVDDLSTHPDGRRRGYGRALLEWVADEAGRRGCDQVHLDSGVEANRLDAHRLYLNTGMRITSFHFAKQAPGA